MVVEADGLVKEIAAVVEVTPPTVVNDGETVIVEVVADAIVVVAAGATVDVVVVVRGTKVVLGDDTPVGRPMLAISETRLFTNASMSYVNATCCSYTALVSRHEVRKNLKRLPTASSDSEYDLWAIA